MIVVVSVEHMMMSAEAVVHRMHDDVICSNSCNLNGRIVTDSHLDVQVGKRQLKNCLVCISATQMVVRGMVTSS